METETPKPPSESTSYPLVAVAHSVPRQKTPPPATTDPTNLSTSCQIGSLSKSFVMKIPKAAGGEALEPAVEENDEKSSLQRDKNHLEHQVVLLVQEKSKMQTSQKELWDMIMAENEETCNQKRELEVQLQSHMEKISELTKEKNRLINKMKEVYKERDEVSSAKSLTESQLLEVQKELSDLKEKGSTNSKSSGESDNLQAVLAALREIASSENQGNWKCQREELEKKIETLEVATSELQKQIEALEEENRRLKKEFEDLQQKAESEARGRDLGNCHELKYSSPFLNPEKEKSETPMPDLENCHMLHSSPEWDQITAKSEELEKAIKVCQEKASELEKKIEIIQQQKEKSEADNKELEANLKASQDELEKFKKESELYQNEKTELAADKKELQKKIELYQNEQVELDAVKAELQKKIEVYQNEQVELAADKEELQKEIEILQKAQAESGPNDGIRKMVDILMESISKPTFDHEKEELRKQVGELQGRNLSTTNSDPKLPWKVYRVTGDRSDGKFVVGLLQHLIKNQKVGEKTHPFYQHFCIKLNVGSTPNYVQYGTSVIKLRYIPSGIVVPNVTCIIGPKCEVNLWHLMEEIEELKKAGVPNLAQRLILSHDCMMYMQSWGSNMNSQWGTRVGEIWREYQSDDDFIKSIQDLQNRYLPGTQPNPDLVRKIISRPCMVKEMNRMFEVLGPYQITIVCEDGRARRIEDPFLCKFPTYSECPDIGSVLDTLGCSNFALLQNILVVRAYDQSMDAPVQPKSDPLFIDLVKKFNPYDRITDIEKKNYQSTTPKPCALSLPCLKHCIRQCIWFQTPPLIIIDRMEILEEACRVPQCVLYQFSNETTFQNTDQMKKAIVQTLGKYKVPEQNVKFSWSPSADPSIFEGHPNF